MRIAVVALLLAATSAGAVTPMGAAAPRPLPRAIAMGQVKTMFQQADTNKDGAITPAEFTGGVEQAILNRPPGTPVPSATQIAQIKQRAAASFARADANRDGKLVLAEMAAQPMAMFDRADRDRDGVLSAAEQQAGMAAIRAQGASKQ